MLLGDGIDLPNVTGLGVGATLLVFVFRTLWRQDDGWRSVLDAARQDAASARLDAAAARLDAAAAREDAAEARSAEGECRRRLSALENEMASVQQIVERRTIDRQPPDGVEKRGEPA